VASYSTGDVGACAPGRKRLDHDVPSERLCGLVWPVLWQLAGEGVVRGFGIGGGMFENCKGELPWASYRH